MADLPVIYNDPILGKKRRGNTADDPYVSITETLYVINGRVALTEIPNRANGVVVSGYTIPLYPSLNDAPLTENTFKVDYFEGVVFFNGEYFNNKALTFTYLGEGRHFFPASGIWIQRQGNEVVKTLQELVDDAEVVIQEARESGEFAQEMGEFAQEVTSDYETMLRNTKKIYKPTVENYAAILTTYPNPELGWTVSVRDTGYIYRWDEFEWVHIGQDDPTGIEVYVSPTKPENINVVWIKMNVSQPYYTRIFVSDTEPENPLLIWLKP